MPAKQFLPFLLLCFFARPGHALVDYTEPEAFVPQSSGAASVSKKAPVSRSTTKPKRQTRGKGLGLQLNTGLSFSAQDVSMGDTNGKVDQLAFEAHIQTRYNIFLAASYAQMKSSDISLVSDKTSYQKGNPEVILGFNWLQFGKPQDLATIDLYGGLSFGQNNSDFATQRSDRFFGVTTAKRFQNFALGLGYEMRLTDDPVAGELAVGNISKLSASLGWVVSNDIRFLVEGHTYNVGNKDVSGGLTQDVKFSVLKPQLQLKLSPLIDLSLGATLRTRRLKEEVLTEAKLWNFDGAYGSSLFAGLSINI